MKPIRGLLQEMFFDAHMRALPTTRGCFRQLVYDGTCALR